MDFYQVKRYILKNNLEDIESIIENICSEISKYISEEDMVLFASALYEAIINAIEHGNLNILYETKKQWLKKNIYHKKLAQALKTEAAKNTFVEVILKIDDTITVIVKDKGSGFNPKQEMKKIEEEGFTRESGRGIIMMKSYFDEIKYNKAGNSVTLLKKLKK